MTPSMSSITAASTDEQVKTLMQSWVETMVVGLNLCPFAAPEVRQQRIVYTVSDAEHSQDAVRDFLQALAHIQDNDESVVSTTLLSFKQTAADFDDFLDLLDYCQQLLEEAGLEGVFQLASFHPRYCFSGVEEDDITNWTNRAPYPTLHLIREGQMARVLMHYDNPDEIPERNMALMESLGKAGLIARFPPLAEYWQ